VKTIEAGLMVREHRCLGTPYKRSIERNLFGRAKHAQTGNGSPAT
jgi:hypothetical protein